MDETRLAMDVFMHMHMYIKDQLQNGIAFHAYYLSKCNFPNCENCGIVLKGYVRYGASMAP